MKIAIHQPAYLPWPGYLDRIAKVDAFVVMDDVQFERGSYINRNKIKNQHGSHWLTVPVKLKGHKGSKINATRIDNTKRWAETHLKQIYHAYARAPRFFEGFKELEALYQHDQGTIDLLCLYHLSFWCAHYEIKTPIHRMPRGLDALGKTEKIIAICWAVGADQYLAGPQSRNYLDMDKMSEAGIKVEFHDYTPPVYPQQWGEFIPGLSILDMWMNTERNPWTDKTSLWLPPTLTMKPSDAAEPLPSTRDGGTASTS